MFSSIATDSTIADLGIVHQDSVVLALSLEFGQAIDTGERAVPWSDLGGIYALDGAREPWPNVHVWRWVDVLLVRWFPVPSPSAAPVARVARVCEWPLSAAYPEQDTRLCKPATAPVLRLIARCPNHRATVARLVAQFPGRKRAAGRKSR